MERAPILGSGSSCSGAALTATATPEVTRQLTHANFHGSNGDRQGWHDGWHGLATGQHCPQFTLLSCLGVHYGKVTLRAFQPSQASISRGGTRTQQVSYIGNADRQHRLVHPSVHGILGRQLHHSWRGTSPQSLALYNVRTAGPKSGRHRHAVFALVPITMNFPRGTFALSHNSIECTAGQVQETACRGTPATLAQQSNATNTFTGHSVAQVTAALSME